MPFAHNEPLDGVLHDGPLRLDEIQKAFQHYLGTEVLRIARKTGRPVKDLCDRAERTLYDWKSGQSPTNVT